MLIPRRVEGLARLGSRRRLGVGDGNRDDQHKTTDPPHRHSPLGRPCGPAGNRLWRRPHRVTSLSVSYTSDNAVRNALIDVATLLRQSSGGMVTLEVAAEQSPPGEVVMAPEGQHSVNMTNLAAVAESYLPLGAFEAPYMFRNLDHFSQTMDSPLGKRLLDDGMRRAEMRILDVWALGVREVTLRDTPASTVEGFSQVKLRVPPAIMFVEGARALGAQPTTMSLDDVYTALRTGTVDGQENALATIKLRDFQHVCRYLVLTHHKIGTVVPALPDSVWETIPAAHQDLILAAFRQGRDRNIRYIREEESRLVSEFEAEGMQTLRPDLDPFRARARMICAGTAAYGGIRWRPRYRGSAGRPAPL